MTIQRAQTNGVTTMIASASLVLSAVVFWSSISNRTTDQINDLSGKIAVIDGQTKSNTQRLDKDESWISVLITAKMNAGRR